MEKIEWAIKWTTLQGRFYLYNYKYCYKELKEQKKYPYLSNALLYTPKHYYEYYFSKFFITISKINETHNLFGFTLTAQLHHKCTFMAKINTQKNITLAHQNILEEPLIILKHNGKGII